MEAVLIKWGQKASDCYRKVALPQVQQREIKWDANLMQLGNIIDVFLTRHVSGTSTHHQEH